MSTAAHTRHKLQMGIWVWTALPVSAIMRLSPTKKFRKFGALAARALPMRLVCSWRRLLDHSDCWVAQTNGRAGSALTQQTAITTTSTTTCIDRYDESRLAHALRSRRF
eukprot:scaffold4577_cov135-Isochrysis_galbana.AAC.6